MMHGQQNVKKCKKNAIIIVMRYVDWLLASCWFILYHIWSFASYHAENAVCFHY